MAERQRSQDGTRETDRFTGDGAAPSQQGRAGGRVERDVGTQDLLKRARDGEDAGVTRVRKADEKEGGTGYIRGSGDDIENVGED